MEIVLVRHASTSWSGQRYCGRSDPPLTDDGIAEAERLAARLGPTLASGIRLVSSPSRRAIATAEAIARACADPVIEQDPRWVETDFGEAEGLAFDELSLRLPELASRVLAGSTEIDWPGGETSAALRDRILDAWTSLIADGRDAVVVTHAGPLLHALALAGRPADLADIPSPGTAVRVSVDLDRTDRRPVLGSRT